ncbi:hypothetical protein RQP46_000620 [Phenoliferia psychrophenolica]
MKATQLLPALALAALPICAQLLIQTTNDGTQWPDAPPIKSERVWGLGSKSYQSGEVLAAPFDESQCPANPGPSCPLDTKDVNTCCVNSPGAYFALTQFWDATPSPVGPIDSWTLHGLWPDYCSESPTDWPSNCDSSRTYSRVGQIRGILKDEPELVAFMDKFWIPDRGSAESFWSHEWNKHGQCVSTLFPKCYTDYVQYEEVVSFFKTAVNLFKGLPTHDFLADHGIVPSVTATYTLAQLQAAAVDKFGHEASWGCKRSSKGWELNQVFYGHVSVGQSRSNPIFVPAAPGKLAVNSCPASGINYFPKDGTAPRPPPPGTPRPPSGGKAFIKVITNSVETGCLISTGKWLVGGTCAGYTVTGSTNEDFQLSTSKGDCQISNTGVFVCASRLKPTSFTLDGQGNLKMASNGSFYAPSIPTRGVQVPIVTEKGPHPVQLQYVAGGR